MTPPQEMHITIVATGDEPSVLNLSQEIEMVKAALLYADRVTLASYRTEMIAMVGGLSGLEGQERTEALWAIVGQLPQGHTFKDAYVALRAKRHKTKDELLAFKAMERALAESSADLSARSAQLAYEAGLGELTPALEEGVLDLYFLGVAEGDTDASVKRMSQLIGDIVAPTSTTLPMFDDGSGGLLQAMVREGVILDARLSAATQAGIAARFIGWTPAFPNASLDVILSARDSLRAPLVRYRAAVTGITRDLEETPIDAEFERVVQDLYRQHVEPALLEIEELSNELGLRESISSVARAGAGRRIAEAVVSFAAAEVAGLPPLLLSAIGVTADIAAQVLHERHEVKGARRENQFYFLYEADKTLARS